MVGMYVAPVSKALMYVVSVGVGLFIYADVEDVFIGDYEDILV